MQLTSLLLNTVYHYISEINFGSYDYRNFFQRLYKHVSVNTTMEIPSSVIGRIFLTVMSGLYLHEKYSVL